jgi:hypothetical protein
MQLFGTGEAAHFCSHYTTIPATVGVSFESYEAANLRANQRLIEGTQEFDSFRCVLLCNAERYLFLAASHYRRSLDLMLPSSSAWAQVTLYYGTWYTAHAILALFGGAVLKKLVVDVERSSPRRQALRVNRISSQYRGSHRQFWDLFYRAVAPLRPRVPANLAIGLIPVSNDPVWQISRRNEVNYDPLEALKLADAFNRTYSHATFPSSLPGALATQYRVFESLIEIAFDFAQQFSVRTDGLAVLGTPSGSPELTAQVRSRVYNERVRGLVSKTQKKAVTGA